MLLLTVQQKAVHCHTVADGTLDQTDIAAEMFYAEEIKLNKPAMQKKQRQGVAYWKSLQCGRPTQEWCRR